MRPGANHATSTSSKLRTRLEIRAASDISQADKDLIIDVLIMRIALFHDLLSTGPTFCAEKAQVSLERTLLGLKVLDVELYAEDWATCREIVTSQSFRKLYDSEGLACQLYFKRTASGRIHYKWISNAVIALIGGDDWYRRVNQFIVFDSRLNLRSLDLTTRCCSDYLDFERTYGERSAYLNPSEEEKPWVVVAKRAARDMFGDFNPKDYPFRPQHGNGATAELGRGASDAWHKNRQFRVDGEVINYLRYRVPGDDWHDWFYLPYRGLRRRAEVVCVPKSITKNRTISKEPTTLQFLQQDLFQAMDDYFSEHPWCRINLHDQERSRRLAVEGSRDGSYATIDLSSASDSVSCCLVETLFGDLPFYYPLVATRSTEAHVRDTLGTINQVIKLEKFAPMGSAVCFPLECMVFSTIVEAAIRVRTGSPSRPGDYLVYGDDIIVRNDCAEGVIELLEFFGFSVNHSKSFWDNDDSPKFREACGVEAFDGVDITPLRLSRRLVSLTNNDSERQAGYGVGMIDLINRTYLYGYRALRRVINNMLTTYRWYRTALRITETEFREFCGDRNSGIWVAMPFVITPDDGATQWQAYGSRSGLSSPIHEYEVKVTIACVRWPTPRKSRSRGSIRPGTIQDDNDYYSWCLRAKCGTHDVDEFFIDKHGLITIRPRDLKWSRKWVVAPAMSHPLLSRQK